MSNGQSIAIVNIGMMTSVGLTTKETSASILADIMRFQETAFLDKGYDPIKMALIPQDGLPDLLVKDVGISFRHKRMLQLATMPLVECAEPLVEFEGTKPSLFLAISDGATSAAIDGDLFIPHLHQQVEEAFDLTSSRYLSSGRAGGLVAIQMAIDKIGTGAVKFAIAGGVDSYLSLALLTALDAESRIKSARNLDGFIPGEGAGFLLLTTRETANEHGLPIMATVSTVVQGTEPGHLYSEEDYSGDGLSEVLAQVLESRDDKSPIRSVLNSMNGEYHWSKEWGIAYLRNKNSFRPEHSIIHPADCFGDIGAAIGPVLVGLAIQSPDTCPSLVYCSSDRGTRTAVIVAI